MGGIRSENGYLLGADGDLPSQRPPARVRSGHPGTEQVGQGLRGMGIAARFRACAI